MTRGNRLLMLLPLALAPAACSEGAPVDLGHDQAQLSDYAASWDGYAEAYMFPEGDSDRVRITLDANGNGTIQVGDAPVEPAPTDPEVGLPGHPGQFHGGFQYPIHGATVVDGRLRFEIDPGERYAAWCAIQIPVPRAEYATGYICVAIPAGKEFTEHSPTEWGTCALWDATPLPNSGSMLTNPSQVSCSRYLPCTYAICSCTASGCAFDPTVPRSDGYRVRLDGALDDGGTNLLGTLAIYADWDHPTQATDRVTIRLHR